jgi:hypothetical protein
MITQKTGFNINNAINVRHVMAEDQPSEDEKETPKRKAAPITADASAPQRKAPAPANKYNVVSKK